MTREAPGPTASGSGAAGEQPDFGTLFHRLNNQLGVILANAELLEARAPDRETSARAGQIVASAVEAITTARDIRNATDRSASPGNSESGAPGRSDASTP